MPITKLAVVGMAAGALTSYQLSDKEKDTLTKYYGMNPDANFKLRNAFRSELQGIGGGFLGGMAAVPLSFVPKVGPFLARNAPLFGYGYGVFTGANKYSPVNARKIMKEYKEGNNE